MIPKRLLAVLIFLAALAYGQQPPQFPYERILVPIVLSQPVPGALGSLWSYELMGHSESTEPVNVTTDPNTPCITACPIVPPHANFRYTLLSQIPGGGAFLYIGNPGRGRVSFNLRIQDLSRQALSWGTEIPVVSENDVRTDVVHLLNVPTDTRFRQTLRIYDFDGRLGKQVLLRAYSINEKLLLETTITLSNGDSAADSHPAFPGYAQIGGLTEQYPQLRSEDRVRIELRPVSPALRFWAFVSITNNETQHVTTITPQ